MSTQNQVFHMFVFVLMCSDQLCQNTTFVFMCVQRFVVVVSVVIVVIIIIVIMNSVIFSM